MAHIATQRYNYWGQLGLLLAFTGGGMIIGSFASMIPLISKMELSNLKNFTDGMTKMMENPANANALRIAQFISVLFLFFLPAWLYAKICHNKPAQHLGFLKAPSVQQLILVAAIMFFSLLIIGAISEVWHQIPFSPRWQAKFKAAEDLYNKQVLVMARMSQPGDYIISIFIVALLPALFEEIFFRGAVQNLLSRWLKAPIWAIVITSILFSAIHFSYDGFFPRLVLGFILGWFFYRTGNIWISIAAHFLNNAIGITMLYATSKNGQPTDLSKLDDRFPIWLGAVGIAAVIGLLYAFDKVSKQDIIRPGQESLLPGYINPNNPFLAEAEETSNQTQV